MSILIKEMQMPHDCFECPLSISPVSDDSPFWMCGGNRMKVHEASTEEHRPYGCPLEEVSEKMISREEFQRLVLDICREHAEKGEDIHTLGSISADLVISIYILFSKR